MLNVKNVDVTINKRPIIKNVSFSVYPGEVLGFIGPNGAGKSTLIKAISHIVRYRGSIQWHGQSLKQMSAKARARFLSYVPQSLELDIPFTVFDAVYMGRFPYKSNRLENEKIVKKALDRVGILHLQDRIVATLSGGQKQLVAMAKAIAQDAQILILDEPTSALDLYFQLQLLDMMKELAEEGRLVLLAIHDLSYAYRFCDRLTLMENGQLTHLGFPKDVITTKRLQETYHVYTKIYEDHHTTAVIPLRVIE
ncbi:ABC transporter ATP-binding protein [Bacillaceae bacterium SIJ1]|uniref:ABC transporter ATP-binding protein n=1 Tax=Litoribacterium kuwaitense TaxID=1398745 RepID=UPI0013EC4D1C|nr:ABC transporter ATP-binding protein [Litoribacterium kuwaitense]NGP44651.1 ABC transporter ATP-binding protein [Litoribacterium kuwaitense]